MPIHLNLVKHQIQSKKLSIDAVADHANVDRNTARATLNGEIKPTPEILTALEKAATQLPDRSERP